MKSINWKTNYWNKGNPVPNDDLDYILSNFRNVRGGSSGIIGIFDDKNFVYFLSQKGEITAEPNQYLDDNITKWTYNKLKRRWEHD